MAKRKQREMADRANIVTKMDLRVGVKIEPDKYEYVRVTEENATKVIEWVVFHTDGQYAPKANFGDVIIRNLWDDSFEVWDSTAFDAHFREVVQLNAPKEN